MKLVIAVLLSATLIHLTHSPALTIQHVSAEAQPVVTTKAEKSLEPVPSPKPAKPVEPEYKANTPKAIAYEKAKQRGWTGTEWNALVTLWHNESGWNPKAYNSSSGACGIPQALPCSKIPNQSVHGQIDWGMNYIASRYGTPTKALSHWNAKVPINGRNMGHWY